MFELLTKRIYFYTLGFILLVLSFIAITVMVNKPSVVNAESGPSGTCSISAWQNGSNPYSRGFSFSYSAPDAEFGSVGPDWLGEFSPWIPYMRNWGINYYHTYSSPGNKTVYGRYHYKKQGGPQVDVECSRTITIVAPNNPPSPVAVVGSCSAAGALDVHITVGDPDGGTPGFSMHIDNVGDFGMDYGGTGWRGTWYPPRNGVTYSIFIHVVDPQTGGVYGPYYGNYTCPPPPTPPTCSLSVNPALVPPNGSSTLTWSSSNATSFSVDQGVGALAPVAGGSRTVFPGVTSKTYTGTVMGPGGSANCATTLTVGSVSCTLNSITAIEPTESYQPQVNVAYVAGGAGNAVVTATVTINNNGTPTTRNSPATTLAPGETRNIDLPPPIVFNAAGNWAVTVKTISGTISGVAFGPTPCGGATLVPVVLKPYFKVFNGGTTVGAGFNSGETTCSPPTDPLVGRVTGFASSTPSLHGASTQFDLKALRSVAATFYSSGANPGGLPTIKALTFANNPGSGDFGGLSCITDYYTTTKDSPTVIPSNSISIGALDALAGSQAEWSGGGMVTILTGNLPLSSKLAVYITGDVYINGNITLNVADSSYGSVAQIPFFALVVKGNIKIAPGVTRLDGLYIAQPNGASGGTVYTCLNADNSIPDLYASCRTKLTFNGSVVAKSIKLFRTNGTLVSGPANETSASVNIAEVFNGMPELFFSNPAFKVDNTELYDSITSLPPLL